MRSHHFTDHHISQLNIPDIVPKGLTLVPDEIFLVIQNLSSRRYEVKFYDPQEDVSYRFWRKGSEAGSERKVETFRVEKQTLNGVVRGSLVASLRKLVDNTWLAYRFMDAYVLDFNLPRILKRGAKFSLTFEKKYDGDHFVKYGEITYTSLEINDVMVERHFLSFKDGGVFIDARTDHEDRPLYAPVDYLHISSLFQPRRLHPIKRRYQAHMGIDFALPTGEEIYAAQAGEVVRAGRNRASGNYVVIRHANGLETYYNHMAHLADDIEPGVHVKNGQVIGYIGCTGYCTKPHLHFAVKKQGRFVNPIHLVKGYPYGKKPLVQRTLAQLERDPDSLKE